MRRLAIGLVAVLAAGCGVNSSATFSVATPATPEDRGPIDYAGWPTLTREPVRVSPEFFAFCRPPVDTPNTVARGPHLAPTVRYHVNPESEVVVKAGTSPVSVGTTIVKEKWLRKDADAPEAYAAMIKREVGYDPENGDWEYLYVTKDEHGKRTIDRGKLASCINCHRIAKDRDYLYRTYLTK
jgi:hypothetical protein